MRWLKCQPNVELLGQREGHCAAVLPVTYLDCKESYESDPRYILVFGGYCAGALSGEPILSPVDELPRLRWNQLQYQAPLECDGASLTQHDAAPEALLFGGLDADLCRRNTLYTLRLCVAERPTVADGSSGHNHQHHSSVGGAEPGRPHELPGLVVTELQVTGDVPAPRSRHGAGFSEGKLYIFGGETDAAEQNNDLYTCERQTGVWRRVHTATPLVPPPRLLCLSLVFVTSSVMVMYGGCRFVDGLVKSLGDVWAFYTDRQSWGELEPSESTAVYGELRPPGWWPHANGHRGCRVSTSAFFVGGKDSATGDDRVKCVRYAPDLDVFKFDLVTPAEVDARGHLITTTTGNGNGANAAAADADEEEEEVLNSRLAHPHWRYTPAMVEVPHGLLLLGGQCRHPQHPAAYLLKM